MKKLLSLLLPLALALSLAACGEKSADEAARQTPPTLTVTSANACSVTLKSSSYDWTYTQGLQSMTVIPVGTSLSNKRQSTLIRTNLRPSFGGQLE